MKDRSEGLLPLSTCIYHLHNSTSRGMFNSLVEAAKLSFKPESSAFLYQSVKMLCLKLLACRGGQNIYLSRDSFDDTSVSESLVIHKSFSKPQTVQHKSICSEVWFLELAYPAENTGSPKTYIA